MKNLGFLAMSLTVLPLIACVPPGVEDGTSPDDATEASLTSHQTLGAVQIMRLARGAGLGCGQPLIVATALAFAESSGRTWITHLNHNGSTDAGLWQINSVHGLSVSSLLVPATNADAMMDVSSNGRHFSPWSTYNNGAYLEHMDEARTAYGTVCR